MSQPAHLDRAASARSPWPRMQFACGWDVDANIATAERLVRQAAKQGAQIILIQELFETPYFCIEQDSRHLRLATTVADNRAINHFAKIARELERGAAHQLLREGQQLVLQFDRDPRCRRHATSACTARRTSRTGPATRRRTTSAPATPASRSGTRSYARIGVGICWDQWFPETRARHGAAWARSCCSTRRPSAASRRRRCR